MNLLTSILAHGEPAPLILPIWAFPLIAAVFFIAVATVTFSYRDVANRHANKAPAADAHGHDSHDGHGAGH